MEFWLELKIRFRNEFIRNIIFKLSYRVKVKYPTMENETKNISSNFNIKLRGSGKILVNEDNSSTPSPKSFEQINVECAGTGKVLIDNVDICRHARNLLKDHSLKLVINNKDIEESSIVKTTAIDKEVSAPQHFHNLNIQAIGSGTIAIWNPSTLCSSQSYFSTHPTDFEKANQFNTLDYVGSHRSKGIVFKNYLENGFYPSNFSIQSIGSGKLLLDTYDLLSSSSSPTNNVSNVHHLNHLNMQVIGSGRIKLKGKDIICPNGNTVLNIHSSKNQEIDKESTHTSWSWAPDWLNGLSVRIEIDMDKNKEDSSIPTGTSNISKEE